jgi:hypothetical protein
MQSPQWFDGSVPSLSFRTSLVSDNYSTRDSLNQITWHSIRMTARGLHGVVRVNFVNEIPMKWKTRLLRSMYIKVGLRKTILQTSEKLEFTKYLCTVYSLSLCKQVWLTCAYWNMGNTLSILDLVNLPRCLLAASVFNPPQ